MIVVLLRAVPVKVIYVKTVCNYHVVDLWLCIIYETNELALAIRVKLFLAQKCCSSRKMARENAERIELIANWHWRHYSFRMLATKFER